MVTCIKTDQRHLQGLVRVAWKPVLLGQLILCLSLGWGDRAFAQSNSDSVLDQIPESAAALVNYQDNNQFLPQILYAGVIVWVISLIENRRG